MRLDCSRCRQVLEYSQVAPRFCSNCGQSLSTAVPTRQTDEGSEDATTVPGGGPVDPLATLGFPGNRTKGHPEQVGNYRLLRALGSGGMGTVYEAEELGTGRHVALKLIRPEFADSRDTVERFRREGRLASALFHPRCVFVLAAEQEAGRPYIVMELMPGNNLHDLIEAKGPLPVREAVAKILDVIEGLQEAHRLGVIHRDVKPSNCFLDEDDRVKVGDFGLAKSLVGPEQLTRSGSFLGTVLFASPEQIRNEHVNYQTDVYSVCATLYYLLTGRAPFQDDDPAAALAKAVTDPPVPMRGFAKDVPRTLDEVVLRGLARSRRARWQNLEEVRLALLPFLDPPECVPEFGWRVTAFLVDLLLLIPFELCTQHLVQRVSPTGLWNSHALLLSPLISLLCGVVYYAIPEWLVGGSPGKFATRLRVRDAMTGDRPSLPRSLWRTFLFYLGLDATSLITAIVLVTVGGWVGHWVLEEHEVGVALRVVVSVVLLALLPILSAGVGVGLLASTMRRRNGYRGVHELLSRTRVIRLPSEPPRFRAPAKAAWPNKAALLAGVPDRVGGYPVLALIRRTPDEMLLQGEDPALQRPTWLWLRKDGPPLPPGRPEAARDARPRWLGGGEQDGWRWEAFVAAVGCPLADLVTKNRRLTWRNALSVLEQLTIELEAAEKDNSLPDRLSPEQVWVQASGRVLLLDAPVRPPTLAATPMDLLRQVAAVALEGQSRKAHVLAEPIHAPIPWHASELMGRLMGGGEPFANLAEVRAALTEAHQQPEEISRPGRALQVGLSFAGLSPGLLVLFGLGPALMLLAYCICVLGAATGEFGREQAQARAEIGVPDQHEELARLDAEMRRLDHDRSVVLASWSWFVVRALARYEDPWQKEYSRLLKAYLQSEDQEPHGLDHLFARSDDLMAGPSGLFQEVTQEWSLIEAILFWPLLWAAWAFATRGGLAPRLAGIRLVGANGQPASRWRCAWRTLLVWTPVALLLLASIWLDVWRVASARDGWTIDEVRVAGWTSWHLWWGAVVLVGVYIFVAIVWPNRGLHDHLSGVYPVPR